jgi:hypothetical protein
MVVLAAWGMIELVRWAKDRNDKTALRDGVLLLILAFFEVLAYRYQSTIDNQLSSTTQYNLDENARLAKSSQAANLKVQELQNLLIDRQGDLLAKERYAEKLIEDNLSYLTGGASYPKVFVLSLPNADGSLQLNISESGKYSLPDVSYSISEIGSTSRQDASLYDGSIPIRRTGLVSVGKIITGNFSTLRFSIKPTNARVMRYSVSMTAANGNYDEMLEIRFSTALRVWQSRSEVKKDWDQPTKVLQSFGEWSPGPRALKAMGLLH